MSGAVIGIALAAIAGGTVLYLKKKKTGPDNTPAEKLQDGVKGGTENLTSEKNDGVQDTGMEEENRFYAPEAQVLIVDDEADSRTHIKSILDKLGVQYETAHNGMQCIEKAKEKEFHILLISHKMARMDGIQTLRNLKKTEGNLSIGAACYALTPAKEETVRDVYMKEGFDGCLSKPVGEYALTYMLMEQLPTDLVTFSGNIKEQTKKAYEAEKLLLEYGITLADGVNRHKGDVEGYKKTATAFADDYEKSHKTLVDLLYDDRYEAYAVAMEQLRDQAEQTGATELVKLADEHIEMAQVEDGRRLESEWREFTLTWESAVKGLREWLGLKDTFTNVTEVLTAHTNGIELSDSELEERLRQVLSDIESGKNGDANAKLADLKKYELPDEVRVFVEITCVAVRMGDVDKARNMIRKIM